MGLAMTIAGVIALMIIYLGAYYHPANGDKAGQITRN